MRLNDGMAVVTLSGEADLGSAPLMQDLLSQGLASGVSSVVVDMAEVTFCDARGLGLLVAASNELRQSGGRLSVRAAPAPLRRLLAITGLSSLLAVEPVVPADLALASGLASAAAVPITRGLLDAALRLVVVMAQSVMRGADGVSITLPRDGRLQTAAASNGVVLQMDQDQYETGEGPCVDAAIQGKPFSSTSLELEGRWPHFVPRARARGIESIMSTPLISGTHPLGALNVYSRTPEALAVHEQEWAVQFSREASNVLIAGHPTVTAASLDAEIATALHSREVIALAQGIIMIRQQLQPEAAYRFLLDVSRRTSQSLVGICQAVVSTAVRNAKVASRDAPWHTEAER